ncbi:hypothetical protein [Arthrobacter sp. A2-55]|uniref:hypothetical protein n=1 Tax=Arthrobacter sp. A2-55 TaxID=2897337 RepID=UPI0021CD8801|nr:hypothetical protein [Arthrobacter sp. A2-55]MCU6478843.1 hypothetical protein [Arthrobacter sp. A2-55]
MHSEAVAAQGGFYAPAGYSILWPLLGAALLVLCAGWLGWVWMSTRPGNTPAVPHFVPPRNAATIKGRYLARIDTLVRQHDAGERGLRETHQELSAAVRSFVHDMTGLKAQRMTLAELRAHQLPSVVRAVETFYPAEFAPPDPGRGEGGPAARTDVALAARVARDAVATWS